MNKHYFTSNNDLESDKKIIKYIDNYVNLSLYTDNGVFSKDFIDYGSRVLINNVFYNDYKNVLDVGCGYGIIGIYIATRLKNSSVDMIDVNQRAIDLCNENIKLNHIQNVKVFNSYIYENVEKKYDLIITNPPIRAGKVVVSNIILGAKEYLNKDGKIWVVMKKNHGAKSMIKYMIEQYGNCEIVAKDKGYYIFYSINI